MKLVRIVVIIVQILFVLSTTFSQNTSIGFRTGVSYFTLNSDDLGDDAKYIAGLNFAIPVEFTISPSFSIQPELHFTQKGVQFKEVVQGEDQSFAVKTNYFEFPILLKSNYSTGRFKLYAFVAPSVGYATNQFSTEKLGDADRIKEKIDFIEEGNAKSQRWEFSAISGVGGSMKAGIGSIVLDVRYNLGLTDHTKFESDKPNDWAKTTNRGYTFSVGYVIPIRVKKFNGSAFHSLNHIPTVSNYFDGF